MAKRIYVSPSSQTDNAYAVGNTTEAVQCRKISAALVVALKRCGFEAMDNATGNMYERVAESNKYNADLHIPIHTNAFNKKVQGTRLFAMDTSGEGYKACKAIMATLAPITPGSSDSITAMPELYEVKKANAPTAYIEVAFHDNETEARWIVEHTNEIAEAICKGVCNYYGYKYIAREQDSVQDSVQEPAAAILYRVQVGAFENRQNAERLRDQLKEKGFDGAYIVKGTA